MMHDANRRNALTKPPGRALRPSDVCDITVVHVDKVRALMDRLLPGHLVQGVAELFKVMGDPTRARIVHALTNEELCVCDLAAVLGMSVSAVSHHLRILRNLHLVKFRKAGRMVYYTLDDEHVIRIFTQGVEHVRESTPDRIALLTRG